jgi:hypothetical protein
VGVVPQIVHAKLSLRSFGQELEYFKVARRNPMLAFELSIEAAQQAAKTTHQLVPLSR